MGAEQVIKAERAVKSERTVKVERMVKFAAGMRMKTGLRIFKKKGVPPHVYSGGRKPKIEVSQQLPTVLPRRAGGGGRGREEKET